MRKENFPHARGLGTGHPGAGRCFQKSIFFPHTWVIFTDASYNFFGISSMMDTLSKGKKRKRRHIDQPIHIPERHVRPHASDLSPAPVPPLTKTDRQSLRDKAKSLESSRKKLPIWSHAAEIREALAGKDVMILVGETGSGKSTQVPQMVVDEPWCKPQSVTVPKDVSNRGDRGEPATGSPDSSRHNVRVGGCIAITEPRRVAATTLARRVAEEMGTPLGSSSPKSTVGYSVRFDQSAGPNTRIKFLTEGTLLQEMLRDPWLRAYSAVVVDEVHERGTNVDLLLGFLRNMVVGKNEGRGGVPLKVCLVRIAFSWLCLPEGIPELAMFYEYRLQCLISCHKMGYVPPPVL